MNTQNIDKYAELVIRTGVNIQNGQTLTISAPIQVADFVHMCMKHAYKAGAKDIDIRWSDKKGDRIRYDMAPDEVFDETKDWMVQRMNHLADIDAAFLSIYSEDPEIMEGVDPLRMSRVQKAYAGPMKPYRNKLMNNKCAWCVVSVPSPAWAKKVFPELSEEDAVEKLWHAVLKSTRADQEDPVAAWTDHQKKLDKKLNYLNSTQFKALKYSNQLGTDLTIELPDNHIWYGGADSHVPKGYKFVANMPTEEIFTLPKRDGVNGKVVSTYPLNYRGTLIKGMWFEFKDGKVITYGAKENQAALKEMISIDEGAKMLGEVALVPYDSPISNQGILFYDTLYDENASCHLAFGEAYAICLEGGGDMSEEALIAAGANVSDTHTDFMIGSEDLNILGIKKDGSHVQIFENGNFAI